MKLQDTIYTRKSTRRFDSRPLCPEVLDQVRQFITTIQPLDATIETEVVLTDRKHISTIFPWGAPHYALCYAKRGEAGLTEVGFRYQQLDLYLQSIGLGSCWLGVAKPKDLASPDPALDYIIMLAFGKAKGSETRQRDQFKRKGFEEISDRPDGRFEPARLAPSAVNLQPWYFQHDGQTIHVFTKASGLLAGRERQRYARIDVGIALSQVALTQPNFHYQVIEPSPELAGHRYVGSIQL